MNVILFDMGLPMIMPSIVLMVVALLPIVFLEAYLIRRKLQTNTKTVLAPVAVANLVSTFLGIPLTWFLLTVLEFVSVHILGAITGRNPWTALFSLTLGAPWVAPGHNNEEWIILGAMLFLLIPYGIASWGVEYFVIRKMASQFPPRELKRVVGKANLASYCLLAIFVIVIFAASFLRSN